MSIQHVSLRQLRVFETAAATVRSPKPPSCCTSRSPGSQCTSRNWKSTPGCPLFERLGKKLFVTEAGQELLARAREILRS